MPAAASHDLLAAALRDVLRALAPPARALADDPLRLALPPLPPGEAPAREALAALYLHAELEEAGVLPAVEALGARRRALTLPDRTTAERLERFALAGRDEPTATERAAIFARLFGLGQPARAGIFDDGVRLDFRQRLLRLATAVVRVEGERRRLGGTPGLASQAAWRAAARDLQALVAAQPAGTLVAWARHIHARTLRAFEVLGDAGLQRQLGSRTPWETLGRLLPEQGAPARDAAARRGAAGQQLLRSLQDEELPAAGTVQAALRWLVASDLPVPVTAPLPTVAPELPRLATSGDPLAEGALAQDCWQDRRAEGAR